jgi:hypothetical protein
LAEEIRGLEKYLGPDNGEVIQRKGELADLDRQRPVPSQLAWMHKSELRIKQKLDQKEFEKQEALDQTAELQHKIIAIEADMAAAQGELEAIQTKRHDLLVRSDTTGGYADLEAFELWTKSANVPLGVSDVFGHFKAWWVAQQAGTPQEQEPVPTGGEKREHEDHPLSDEDFGDLAQTIGIDPTTLNPTQLQNFKDAFKVKRQKHG